MKKIKFKKRGAILPWVLGIFVVIFITATLVCSGVMSNLRMNASYNDTNDMDNAVNSAINIVAYYYKTARGVKELLDKDERRILKLSDDYIATFINKGDTLNKFKYTITLSMYDKKTIIINVNVENKDGTKFKKASGKINKVFVEEDIT